MQMSRRGFLGISIPASVFFLLGKPVLAALTQNTETTSQKPDEKAMLYDASKCVGCLACEGACRRQNDLPPTLTYTSIEAVQTESNGDEQTSFRKYQCMHCGEAACVEVCPTKALTHHELGFTAYDREKCIGCGYCTEFCPFYVPRLSGNKLTGIEKMDKCDFCADRVINNGMTACAEACPVQALKFGNKADLIIQGRKRVAELKKTCPSAILYGEDQLGGLHVMHVLTAFPVTYHLPEDTGMPVSTVAWKNIIQPLGLAMGGLTIFGLGMNYMVARKVKRVRELPDEEEK